MALDLEYASGDHPSSFTAKMAVLGVGGAGGNAVRRMHQEGLEGVDLIAANTDRQALDEISEACGDRVRIVQIGSDRTKGLGAGARPELGRQAIEESLDSIADMIEGLDLLFIAAGMGGGTGTGAAPVIASKATEMGILTIAVVTTPFGWEGRRRFGYAQEGVDALNAAADTVITVRNERLLETLPEDVGFSEALQIADGVLMGAVQGIASVLSRGGEINVDFADVKTVMGGGGPAILGLGYATGEDGARAAALDAVNNPLVDHLQLSGATRCLVNVRAARRLDARSVAEAVQAVGEAAHPKAEIIFGLEFDGSEHDRIGVTVIATGFEPTGLDHGFGIDLPEADSEDGGTEDGDPDDEVPSPPNASRRRTRRPFGRLVRWARSVKASAASDSLPDRPRRKPDYLEG